MMLQKITRSFTKKTILSCQNHGTIKVKLYNARKKGSAIFFNYSSVRSDVFIDHVSSASVQIFNADFSSIQEL